MFPSSSFPTPSFSFPASQGEVRKLKDLHFPLELSPRFPPLWHRERKEIIKTSAELHMLDFLTLAWTFPQFAYSYSMGRQGDLKGFILHTVMAKASVRCCIYLRLDTHLFTWVLPTHTHWCNSVIASGTGIAQVSKLHLWMWYEKHRPKIWGLSYDSENPKIQRIIWTFGCLSELRNLLRFLSDWQ